MKPTADLIQEHGIIKLAIRILDKINEKIKSGKTVKDDDLNKMIVFIREFADKCHHGKEEEYLFPEMLKSGISEEKTVIGNLLDEHKEGRKFVKDMAESIGRRDYARFAESAEKYARLLDRHIDKENTIMFRMADKSLSIEKQNKIEEGFEDIEENRIGEGRHKELLDLAMELRKSYL